MFNKIEKTTQGNNIQETYVQNQFQTAKNNLREVNLMQYNVQLQNSIDNVGYYDDRLRGWTRNSIN